jgi:maltose alpha-D-glucosyltransferase/alpha-amylase
MTREMNHIDEDPLWYKDAIIYELHIKAFYDSDGDGIGDFNGLRQKLDYLENLGITAIWLLPFYPSPFRDDGYDIGDYFNIHPDYGTLRDFREFLKEAHRRGIKVITELVLNHTSDQHEWFKKSRRAKAGSKWRDYYVWSDTPDLYKDARIIFKDFETSNWAWDPVAKAYYWHRFYSHQPDLNYANPNVQKSMFRVIDYWMDMGVDGMRLDAVPYLFEREGTNCENLPDTFEFLKRLRSHVDSKYRNKIFLAEANQWPEDVIGYFGNGDKCHMAYHFPLMPRIFMSCWMEDSFPITDILDQTPKIPNTTQWALFLRNHDELTLEMVTDEERDYMYRIYAKDPTARINLGIRRRLAPLLRNHRRKIDLMNFLLFSLPGTPIIYYGDEIGMGDNYYLGDRNGVRTPMQWSADRNAGFSQANPQKLYLPAIIDPEYHYEAINVENQETNQSSLLWWMRRVLDMRKRFKAFGRGGIKFLRTDNPKVLSFIRRHDDETILAVVNLSRFSQVANIDLAKFAGYVPEELFSRNKFPAIGESPYIFTLGFYDYFWFLLKKGEKAVSLQESQNIPQLSVAGSWESVFRAKSKEKLEEEIIPIYLRRCRWFGGKARKIQLSTIVEIIRVKSNSFIGYILLIEVKYTEGSPDTYQLPVSFLSGTEAENIKKEAPQAVIANLISKSNDGVLYDCVNNEEFRTNILLTISKRHSFKGIKGEFNAYPGKYLRRFNKAKKLPLGKSRVLQAEQTNTSVIYGNELFFKLYRKLDEGMNPDLEIGRFLTEYTSFPNVPPFAGAIEYKRRGSEPIVLGILQALVPNQGDAWTYTLDSLEDYFERVRAKKIDVKEIPKTSKSLLQIAFDDIPVIFQELISGIFLEMMSLLGKRTAELHLALSPEVEDPNFVPEPFSTLYQRSLYQSMESLTKRVMEMVRNNLNTLPVDLTDKLIALLGREMVILDQFKEIYRKKLSATKIRIHGDYHLGQILFTGNDFVIIDFEGEPARPLGERRLKRSPLRDVAGMIRSFHYAVFNSLFKYSSRDTKFVEAIKPWGEIWYKLVAGIFLKSYIDTARDAPFIPNKSEELDTLLRAFLLEKAVYELGYEMNNRPDWVIIPIEGINNILEVE